MSRKKKQLHTEKSKDLGNAKQQHEASTVVPGTAKEKDFKESTQVGQKKTVKTCSKEHAKLSSIAKTKNSRSLTKSKQKQTAVDSTGVGPNNQNIKVIELTHGDATGNEQCRFTRLRQQSGGEVYQQAEKKDKKRSASDTATDTKKQPTALGAKRDDREEKKAAKMAMDPDKQSKKLSTKEVNNQSSRSPRTATAVASAISKPPIEESQKNNESGFDWMAERDHAELKAKSKQQRRRRRQEQQEQQQQQQQQQQEDSIGGSPAEAGDADATKSGVDGKLSISSSGKRRSRGRGRHNLAKKNVVN